MKRIEILVMAFIVCLSGIVLAGGMDDLIAAGGRLERVETALTATSNVTPVTITGRANATIKVVAITAIPTNDTQTITVKLTPRGGTERSLFALTQAVTNEVWVYDLENKVYNADGGTNVTVTSQYPVWLRDGDTLSLYGVTNKAATLSYDVVVVPLKR
jgi:hypothetical protein